MYLYILGAQQPTQTLVCGFMSMIFHNIMHQLMVENGHPTKLDLSQLFGTFSAKFTRVTVSDVDSFIGCFENFCTSIGSFENVVIEHLRETTPAPPAPKPPPEEHRSRNFICQACKHEYLTKRKMYNCDCQSKQSPDIKQSLALTITPRRIEDSIFRNTPLVDYAENSDSSDDAGGDLSDRGDEDWLLETANKKRDRSDLTSDDDDNSKKREKIIKKEKSGKGKKKGKKSRRTVDTNPETPIQVKDETSERLMYSALIKFVKAQSISTPSKPEHRSNFPKVQPIAMIFDEMVQEPDKQSDLVLRREIPEVNFIAPNDMTKETLGSLLVQCGNALQGRDENGAMLQEDAETAIKVHFFNSGCEKSAIAVANNLYGDDANLEKKYGPKRRPTKKK